MSCGVSIGIIAHLGCVDRIAVERMIADQLAGPGDPVLLVESSESGHITESFGVSLPDGGIGLSGRLRCDGEVFDGIYPAQHEHCSVMPAGGPLGKVTAKRSATAPDFGAMAYSIAGLALTNYRYLLVHASDDIAAPGFDLMLRMVHLLIILRSDGEKNMPSDVAAAIDAIHPKRHSHLKRIAVLQVPTRASQTDNKIPDVVRDIMAHVHGFSANSRR